MWLAEVQCSRSIPSYLFYGGRKVNRDWTTWSTRWIVIYCNVLSLLCLQYQIFIPMVNKVMLKHRVNHQRYDILICRIVKVRSFSSDVSFFMSVVHSCLKSKFPWHKMKTQRNKRLTYSFLFICIPSGRKWFIRRVLINCKHACGLFACGLFEFMCVFVAVLGLYSGRRGRGPFNLPAPPDSGQPRWRSCQWPGWTRSYEKASR